jgi:hypothetical protein
LELVGDFLGVVSADSPELVGTIVEVEVTPSDPGAGLVDHLRRESAECSDSSANSV